MSNQIRFTALEKSIILKLRKYMLYFLCRLCQVFTPAKAKILDSGNDAMQCHQKALVVCCGGKFWASPVWQSYQIYRALFLHFILKSASIDQLFYFVFSKKNEIQVIQHWRKYFFSVPNFLIHYVHFFKYKPKPIVKINSHFHTHINPSQTEKLIDNLALLLSLLNF